MVKEWGVFISRCIEQRVQPELFEAAAAQLHSKSPLPGHKLAALLLQPRNQGPLSVDPRLVVYLERLLTTKRISASDVLSSAFKYSKDQPSKTGKDGVAKGSQPHIPPELEEIILNRLAKGFQIEERPQTNTEGRETLQIVSRWMQAIVTSHTSDTMIQAMAGIQQQPQQQSINVRDSMGVLVVAIVENPKMLRILNHSSMKGKISSLKTTRDNRAVTD